MSVNVEKPNSANEYIDACLSMMSTRKKTLIICALAFGSISDVVEIVCIGFILSSLRHEITQTEKEMLGASVLLGLLFGGFFAGQFSDKCGRKLAFQVSLTVSGVSAFISAFSPNVTALIVFRVFSGIGIGGLLPTIYSMCAELFSAKDKNFALTVLNSCGIIGSLFAAFTGWLILGDDSEGHRIIPTATWRTYAVVSSLPAFCGLFLSYFLVETPIYLLGKERREEAAASLSSLSNRTIIAANLPTIVNNSRVSVFAVFWKPYLYPISVLCIIWATFLFAQFGLLTWVTTLLFNLDVVNPYSDACLFAVVSIIGYLFSLRYMSYLGRKNLLVAGILLSALCILFFGIGSSNAGAVVTCMCFYSIFSVIAWNALCCLSSDSYFPSSIRGSAMGYAATSGRIGGILAQFLFAAYENNAPVVLFVTSASLAFGGLVSFLLPKENTNNSDEELVTTNLLKV